jgi:hypothetical protein
MLGAGPVPDSVDTISLRDDRPAAKQDARERAIKSAVAKRAACLAAAARYPIYAIPLGLKSTSRSCARQAA